MPRLAATAHLSRYVSGIPRDADGATAREVLESAFTRCPLLRGYVVDEHGRLRKHVMLFIDGKPVDDRDALSDPVGPGQELFIMQALSGG